ERNSGFGVGELRVATFQRGRRRQRVLTVLQRLRGGERPCAVLVDLEVALPRVGRGLHRARLGDGAFDLQADRGPREGRTGEDDVTGDRGAVLGRGDGDLRRLDAEVGHRGLLGVTVELLRDGRVEALADRQVRFRRDGPGAVLADRRLAHDLVADGQGDRGAGLAGAGEVGTDVAGGLPIGRGLHRELLDLHLGGGEVALDDLGLRVLAVRGLQLVGVLTRL